MLNIQPSKGKAHHSNCAKRTPKATSVSKHERAQVHSCGYLVGCVRHTAKAAWLIGAVLGTQLSLC